MISSNYEFQELSNEVWTIVYDQKWWNKRKWNFCLIIYISYRNLLILLDYQYGQLCASCMCPWHNMGTLYTVIHDLKLCKNQNNVLLLHDGKNWASMCMMMCWAQTLPFHLRINGRKNSLGMTSNGLDQLGCEMSHGLCYWMTHNTSDL